MEAIGFALSLPPVLGGLLRVIEYVNDMQAKFEAVPTTMSSIIAQCSTMNIVLGRLQYLDISRAVPSEKDRARLLRDISSIISGCKITLTQLENILLSLYKSEDDNSDVSFSSSRVGTKIRFMFLRYDGQIKDLLSQLSSYHSSVLLLLATAQWLVYRIACFIKTFFASIVLTCSIIVIS